MKKLFGRTMAWLLAVSLLMTGMGNLLPDALQDLFRLASIAQAERQGIPEAYALEAAPVGDEQVSGQWRYALRTEDGYAVITGYSGEKTDELQVPAELDGADVVGIASGALALKGLQHITLHGNIMDIAEDAFGAARPVIHALNGSYALWWADRHGMAYQNETEGTLVPGVIDFTDVAPERIRRRGDSYVVFNPLEGMRLQEGTLFWYVDARGLQYVYRVTELQQDRRSVVAAVETPQLHEAVIDMHGEGVIQATAGDFIYADGIQPEGEASTYDIFRDEDSREMIIPTIKIYAQNNPDEDAPGSEDIPGKKGELSIGGTYYAQIYYRYDIEDGETVSAETITESTYNLDISAELSRDITRFQKETPKYDKEVKIGQLIIGGAIVQARADICCYVEISGAVSGSVVKNDIQHMVYRKGMSDWALQDEDQDIDINEVTGAASGKFAIEANLSVTIMGILNGFQITVECGIEGTLEKQWYSKLEVERCQTFELRPFMRLKVSVGVWFEISDLELGLQEVIFDSSKIENNPIEKLCDKLSIKFHISWNYGIHKVEDCPDDLFVLVSFDTRTGSEIEPVKVMRGQTMSYVDRMYLPDHPTAGRHLGWSADISAEEADWYIGSNGSIVKDYMTLYAVWEHTVTVDFKSDGGSAVPSQQVPVGGYATEPETPKKGEAMFRYWYTLNKEDNFPEKWFFTMDECEEDCTLTALWSDSEIETDGTDYACLGNKKVYAADYGPVRSTVEYFTYSRVKDPDGNTIGIIITGVKGNPTNVKVPQNMEIPLTDSEYDFTRVSTKVVGVAYDAFSYNTTLQKVTIYIPDLTLTTKNLFRGCTSLKCVDLTGIKFITLPDDTFNGCSSLECVMMPAGVKEYGNAAFANCTSMIEPVIPYGITRVGNSAFENCSSITQMRLPGSMMEVGKNAFKGCSGIQHLYVPDSIQHIGESAFWNCFGVTHLDIGGPSAIGTEMYATGSQVLKDVVIRGTVETVGYGAFDSQAGYYDPEEYYTSDRNGYHYTTTDARLVIEEGVKAIANGAFRNCDIFTDIQLPDSITSVGNYSFEGCDRIKTVDIPASLEALGEGAFYNCDGLTELMIPGTLKKIGRKAFSDCDAITKLVLSEGVNVLEKEAFRYCDGITELRTPGSLTSIEEAAFWNCPNVTRLDIGGPSAIGTEMYATGSQVLKEVVIRGTVNTVGYAAFDSNAGYYYPEDYYREDGSGYHYETTDARLVIEEGVKTIGNYAFRNCDIFTEIQLADSITYVGNYAFESCDRITTADIPGSLEALGEGAYYNCDGLTELVIPGTLKTIGIKAFYDCDAITKPVLSEGVTTIREEAFRYCDGITELRTPASLNSIEEAAFWNCPNVTRLDIGGPWTIEAEMYATGSQVLKEVVIRGTVNTVGYAAFDSQAGYYNPEEYYSKDRNGYHFTTTDARLIIEEGVKTINAHAFRNCDIFTEIQLADSITSVGNYSFENCDRITKVDFPASLEALGEGAYFNCDGLTELVIPGTLKTIGIRAFYDCDAITKLLLSEGVTTIRKEAFRYCDGITELRTPSSLNSIEEAAFWDCPNVTHLDISGPSVIGTEMYATGSQVLKEVVIRGTVNTVGYAAFDSNFGHYYPQDYYREDGNGYHYDTSDARLVIEEGVKTIGRYAFRNCRIFTEVVFPQSIESIQSEAFRNCDRIYLMLFGDAQPSISEDAFYGCYAPPSVYIAFNNYALEDLFAGLGMDLQFMNQGEKIGVWVVLDANGGTFADGSETMIVETVWNAQMPQLEIPANGEFTFTGWYQDPECKQPFQVATVPGDGAYLYAGWEMRQHSLTLVGNGGLIPWNGSMHDTLTLTANAGTQPVENLAAFADRMSFTGWYTDIGCTKPFTGTMPDEDIVLYAGYALSSVNGDYEFENGEARLVRYTMVGSESADIRLPETVNGMPLTAIAANAFAGEAVRSLTLPSAIKRIDENAFADMAALEEIRVNPANADFCGIDGVLFSKDASELICYPSHRGLGYSLPKTVRSIAAHAFENSEIRTICLNDGLETIGDSAFANTGIVLLELPESLVSIGRCAFYGCEGIVTVTAGENLAEIGELAFFGCADRLSMYGPVDDCAIRRYAQKYGCNYNQYLLELREPDGSSRLRIVQAGSSFVLPAKPALRENTEFTGWFTDAACTQLWNAGDGMPAANLVLYGGSTPVFAVEQVTVTTQEETFDEATGETVLTETSHIAQRLTQYLSQNALAVVPESIGGYPVEQIAAGCFGEHVNEAIVPDCVNFIEAGAFANASVKIHCSEGSAAAEYAANNGGVSLRPESTIRFVVNGGAEIEPITAAQGEAIALPVPVRSGCEAAGWYLDAELTEKVTLDAEGLWTVPMRDNVLYAAWNIKDALLAEVGFTYEQQDGTIIVTGLVESVTDLEIPEVLHGLPVTEIDTSAFRGELNLRTVKIPGSIERISDDAFRNCIALEEVTLAEGIREIGKSAFYGCSSLSTVVLPDSVVSAGEKAFANSGLTQLHLGANLSVIDSSTLNGCRNLISVAVAENNPYFVSRSGVLYDVVDSVLVKYPAGRMDATCTVDASCYVIGANAFSDAAHLENVVLHDEIWEIGENAFRGCSALKQLPAMTSDYLVTIPDGCFAECDALEEISISANIEVIGQNAFANCDGLKKAIVPETVVYIGKNAFTGGVTIYGAKDSVAQQYAAENGILFVDPDAVLPESIEIVGIDGALKCGETIQLTALISPANSNMTDVSWYSSNENVVRISKNGMLRAVSGGTAEISAWTENGKSAKITVQVEGTTEVEELILNVLQASLYMEETLQLKVECLPNYATDQTVEWTSSNPSIATVDENGLVTAAAYGITTIMAKAHNGVSAHCDLIVKPLTDSVLISGATTGESYARGTKLQLKSMVFVEGAMSDSVRYASSDESVALVDEQGLVTFLSAGYVKITATAVENSTLSAKIELECLADQVLTLPAALVNIEEEAFSGMGAECVIIPEGVVSIGSKAFADCAHLYKVILPESVTEIAGDAFAESAPVICAPDGSYAQIFAGNAGLEFKPLP